MTGWERMEASAKKTLAARIKEHSIPEIPYLPSDDVVLVYRLPPPPKIEKTESGLFVPLPGRDYALKDGTIQTSEIPDTIVKPMGVLLAAGLGAYDWMICHGYQLGDVVAFGFYAGHEQDFTQGELYRSEKDMKKILQLRKTDLLGSVDAIERVNGPRPSLRMVRTETKDGVLHIYQPIAEGKK